MTDNEQTTRPGSARRIRKRADGEGSIYQRVDALWVGELMVGYRPDGKPDRRRVSAKTQMECRRKLDALKQQHAHGTLTDRAKQHTLAGYLDRWLAGVKVRVRPTTHERYAELLRLHVTPTLGKKRLDSIKPDDVQRLYALLLTKEVDAGQARKPGVGAALSPRTVHHVHTVLHTALEQAVKWGYLARNVCDVVDAPKVPARELRAPSSEDAAALLDAATADPLLTLWTLAVYSGARQGELLGLQWPDVDLEGGRLTIARTLLQTTRGGIPAYAPPKTARSRRTLALPEEAMQALRTHRQRQLEQRLLLGTDYSDYHLVFASAIGTPLGYRNVSRSFKAALVRAGLPATIRFHDLRHGHATALRRAGTDIKTVSERLGHSSIGITADLYTHAVPQADVDAAQALQALIRPSKHHAAR